MSRKDIKELNECAVCAMEETVNALLKKGMISVDNARGFLATHIAVCLTKDSGHARTLKLWGEQDEESVLVVIGETYEHDEES